MIKSTSLAIFSAVVGASMLSLAGNAQAQTVVDRQLEFVIDGSGSIASSDFGLQIDAYKAIFTDPNFFTTYVAPLPNQKIAVGALQFGSSVTEIAPLTLISSQADATAFANFFSSVPKDDGGTDTAAAINEATKVLITNNTAFSGPEIIDISTDGVPNDASEARQASIDSIAAGVNVINAIGVGSIDFSFLSNDLVRGTNVNGSPAFVLEASNFQQFQATLNQKFGSEVGPSDIIPEPSTIVGLLSVSVFGVGSMLKRKQKSKLNIAQLNAK